MRISDWSSDVCSSDLIAHNLERMGDYAKNMAKRASALAQLQAVGPVNGISRMGRLTHVIIKEVLDAYAEPNVDKAVSAWNRDQDIDQMYNSLFRELLTYMMEDPRNITRSEEHTSELQSLMRIPY